MAQMQSPCTMPLTLPDPPSRLIPPVALTFATAQFTFTLSPELTVVVPVVFTVMSPDVSILVLLHLS